MASVKCTHCGAVLNLASPPVPGKKIKCPKCTEVFVIEGEDEREDDEANEAPASRKPAKDDYGDEDEAPNKSKKEPKKGGSMILFIILGVVLLLCCGGCGGVYFVFKASIDALVGLGNDLKNAQHTPEDKKVELVPEFKMTAVELAAEFVKDAKAGQAKYKDKVFEITGEVDSVGPTLDQMFLKGAARDAKLPGGFGVRLGIPPAQQAQCARLSKGQKVKAVGKYLSMTEAWLTITDCTVTELEKSTTVTMSADDLAKEYEKDAAAATEKFKTQQIIITGTVEDLRTDKYGDKYALLKGTGKVRVAVNAMNVFQIEFAKGHTIEARIPMEFTQFLAKNNELRLVPQPVISSK